MTDFASDDRSEETGDPDRTDAELIDATRRGDRDAFAALWSRHLDAALKVARSITRRFDAEDIASEAFARVYRALRAGNGPDESLMPYLAATIRNTAATWGSRMKEIAVEDPTAYQDSEAAVQSAAARDSVVSTAFLALPERWREALWYSEVEGYTAAEIGATLGLSANAAAALTYRAREGLRTAWVQAHLDVVATRPECQFVGKNLGAYARGAVTTPVRKRIERHLRHSHSCTELAREAADVARRLRTTNVVGGIVAGAASAHQKSSSGAS